MEGESGASLILFKRWGINSRPRPLAGAALTTRGQLWALARRRSEPSSKAWLRKR